MFDMSKINFEKLGKGLATAKDLVILFVVIVVGYKYLPMLVFGEATEGYEIAEINLFVVKLKPSQPETLVEVAVAASDIAMPASTDRASEPPQSISQQRPFVVQKQIGSESTARVTIAESKIVNPSTKLDDATRISGWSYLGTFKDNRYSDLTFKIDKSLSPKSLKGLTLSAVTDVFIRDDYPRFTIGWNKGNRSGVLKANSQARVSAVKLIPAKGGGSRVWVRH